MNRKCGDFDAVVEWGKAHYVDDDKFKEVLRLPKPERTWIGPAPWMGKTDSELGHKLDHNIRY